MTPGEFREVAKAMREFGLTRVKMGDIELIADGHALDSQVNRSREPSAPLSSYKLPIEISKPEDNVIEHKVEELSSLLKLNDVDLVNRLFPEPKEAV